MRATALILLLVVLGAAPVRAKVFYAKSEALKLVCAFYEPLDYLPSDRWLGQFKGRGPASQPRIGNDVVSITGATRPGRSCCATRRSTSDAGLEESSAWPRRGPRRS